LPTLKANGSVFSSLPTTLRPLSPKSSAAFPMPCGRTSKKSSFDDASQDENFALALGYKQLNPNAKLQVFKNDKNHGYGGNQILGYKYFMERGFDIVVLLHSNGQYVPEVLAHMYHPLVAGQADAVFGSRS
jgi:hypothetical protein